MAISLALVLALFCGLPAAAGPAVESPSPVRPAAGAAPPAPDPGDPPTPLSEENAASPTALTAAPGPEAAPEPGQEGIDQKGRAAWTELEPGLAFGEFQLNESEARLTALRIDPSYFEFVLCASSQDGRSARTLSDWGEQYDLAAAINASMYLPDGSTSTGYMRQGGHVNNKRLVRRFGAFFVAGPDDARLPAAAILDRDSPDWQQLIEHYSLVIQNYRMINADRRILWSPGGPLYSISAVAQDGDGHILFLHCREPVEAYSFAQQLLHLPLDVRTVMYVEGGAQAGLLVRSASLERELAGRHAADFLITGNLKALLPNVLGARRRTLPDAVSAPGGQSAQLPAAAGKSAGEPTGQISGQAPGQAEGQVPARAPEQNSAQVPERPFERPAPEPAPAAAPETRQE